MKGYYAEVTKLLRENGFALLRAGKGSHEVWSKGSIHLTVPYGRRHCQEALIGVRPRADAAAWRGRTGGRNTARLTACASAPLDDLVSTSTIRSEAALRCA